MRVKSKKRKIISLCILLSGVVVSFLILNPWSQTQKEKNAETIIVAEDAINPQLDFFIQPLANLTDEFTNKSLEKLVKDNEGKISQGIKDPKQLTLLPKENDVEKIVNDIIDGDFDNEKVDESKIVTNSDNSKWKQIAYLLVIDRILKENAAIIQSESVDKRTITEYFGRIANHFSDTEELLLGVVVPSSWTQIHKELVEYIIKQKNIYTALSTGDEDPLRFMIAIKRIPQISESEFQEIQIQINNKMREQKLI